MAWKHINFSENIIQVERSWSSLGAFQNLISSASRRAVPMLPYLVHTLSQLRDSQGKPGPDKFLFTFDGTRPLDQSNVRKDFTASLGKAGHRRVTLYSLRHSFASVMVASGASIKALQRCLGHASAAMTLNIYSHLIQENLGTSIDRADKILTAGIIKSEKKEKTDILNGETDDRQLILFEHV